MIYQLKAVLFGVLGAFALGSQAIAATATAPTAIATQQTSVLQPKATLPAIKQAPLLVSPSKTQLFVLPTTRAG